MAALTHATAPSAVLTDLKTVADCDETLDAITAFIAQAERRLSTVLPRSHNEPAGWRAGLTAELRIAKLTLPRLQERRAEVKRQERRDRQRADVEAARVASQTKRQVLLSIVREIAPEVMSRADRIAQARYPDLFGCEEARA